MGRKERWIQHYSSSQKILLVGEGDFSFSACLARAFGSATNMVATSPHSEGTNKGLLYRA
jgi:25S rRNA (uracil2634-N3)-methyltransferase